MSQSRGQELLGNGMGEPPSDISALLQYSSHIPPLPLPVHHGRLGMRRREVVLFSWQLGKANVKTLKRRMPQLACGLSTGTLCEIHISSHCFVCLLLNSLESKIKSLK